MQAEGFMLDGFTLYDIVEETSELLWDDQAKRIQETVAQMQAATDRAASALKTAQKEHAAVLRDAQKQHATALRDAQKEHTTALKEAEAKHAKALHAARWLKQPA